MNKTRKSLHTIGIPAAYVLLAAGLFLLHPLAALGDGNDAQGGEFITGTPTEMSGTGGGTSGGNSGAGNEGAGTEGGISAATPSQMDGGPDDTDSPSYDPSYILTVAQESGAVIDTVVIHRSDLDEWGSYTVMVSADAVSIPEDRAFGGWYDGKGMSLYSYMYDGSYFISAYPAGDMLIKMKTAAEDYFIEDEVKVYTSERVSISDGEETDGTEGAGEEARNE